MIWEYIDTFDRKLKRRNVMAGIAKSGAFHDLKDFSPKNIDCSKKDLVEKKLKAVIAKTDIKVLSSALRSIHNNSPSSHLGIVSDGVDLYGDTKVNYC
jgi:hypothetical protein